MPRNEANAISEAIASSRLRAMPRFSLIKTVLRECLARAPVARVPEPILLMAESEQLDDYMASAFDVMSPLYLFNALLSSDVLREGDTVLDLGCGPATQLAWTAALNPNVHFIGVDLSQECLERGRGLLEAQGLTNVELRVGDITQLPLTDGSVDAVLSTLALHHLPDMAHLERCFAEVHRVLRPGGGVCLSDFGRLKTLDSMADFVALDVERTPRRMSIDYWHSLRAAFSIGELRRASTPLAKNAEWSGTWGLPLLLTMRSKPRRSTPSRRMKDAIRSRLKDMSSPSRKNFATLMLLGRLGGVRSVHLRAAV